MSGAATFLDVVTILSGVLMLCVAFIILYNKMPEIAEEWRILVGQENGVVCCRDQRQREIVAKAMYDIEKGKTCKDNLKPPRPQSTPTKAATARIQQVPTFESPESQDSSIELALRDVHDDDDDDELYKDDYVAKFMKQRKLARAASSPSQKSVADSCSVYLEGSVQSATSTMEPMSYAPMFSPGSKVDKMTMPVDDDDDLSTSMSYSLDTIDNKESFSSYAKPTNYSHIASRIDDDTTTCPGTQINPFSFLSKHNITLATNVSEDHIHAVESNLNESYEESLLQGRTQPKTTHTPIQEEEEEAVVPLATKHSDASKYTRHSEMSKRSENNSKHSAILSSGNSKRSVLSSGISPVVARCLEVTNHSEEEPPTILASSHSTGLRTVDSSNVASRDSFSPLARRNVTFSSTLLDESSSEDAELSRKQSRTDLDLRKPKITIITNKSLLSLDDDDDDSDETPSIEKGITPYTVSTSGMWSSSASMSAQSSDLDGHDASFSTYADSLPSDEAAADRRESPLQDVHCCKSASCQTCRFPAQNSPTFLSTSIPSTGEHYTLERKLPARWWDSQLASYGHLKSYVSKILLSSDTTDEPGSSSVVLNGSVEDHPFDES
ncbi:expressed unknown protein [Seminavis robusta]|uniref:Uncharacterized protein n=1 Tax=Seminavis robusta TaxID=568900 RepID=A0A9N8HFY0_9STRA|nr:expressed unknown protein [Seminavis robusta]|eukprot:Sro371_g128530.1 n/a (610) ;mRNA; f:16348-18291